MKTSTIRFSTFPRTEPPPGFVEDVVAVFRQHESEIATETKDKGLKSDEVLAVLGPDLADLGFQVEASKKKVDKLERPVFFGENGIPTLRYEIDAYHPTWKCGLEVEAGRGWMGNAVYRDLRTFTLSHPIRRRSLIAGWPELPVAGCSLRLLRYHHKHEQELRSMYGP